MKNPVARPGMQAVRRLSRRRMALNLIRNLWFLRGELWGLLRRKKDERPAPIALRCVACKHELHKPCIRGRTKHVVKWPADVPGFKEGQLVAVRRQKPRGGEYDKDYDFEALT
jgi:hypothetical protein